MTREVWRHPDRPGGLDPLLDARFEELTATGSLPIVELGPRHVTRPTERSRTVTAVRIGRIRKALVSGAGALSAALATGAADGSLDRLDWMIAAGAALAVGWATWQTPNVPPAPTPPAGPVVDEH